MASKVKLAAVPVRTIVEAESFDGPCEFAPKKSHDRPSQLTDFYFLVLKRSLFFCFNFHPTYSPFHFCLVSFYFILFMKLFR